MITRRALLPLLAAVPFRRQIPSEKLPTPAQTRLIFGGDVMLSRFVGRVARSKNDPAWPLRQLAPVLSSADIAFVNLESPFSDRGEPVDEGMVFKAEPEMIGALEIAGIDVVSTANNHARDRLGYGVEYTLDWLAQHGIAAAGSGKSAEAAHAGVIVERKGIRFGFLGYTYDQMNGIHSDIDDRIATIDIGRMRRDVAGLLNRADVAIVSMHAGWEYSSHPNPQQTQFARAAIDAGASIVVGHHPHVVQPWERHGDGVIFYSLGNLVFDQSKRADTSHGILADVTFNGKTLADARVMTVDIVRTVPRLLSSIRNVSADEGDGGK